MCDCVLNINSPDNMGLLDPATRDGRVIFFLPWEKMTIAGTTDTPTDVTAHPIPMEEDINFILSEVRHYLSPDVDGTVTFRHKCFNQHCILATLRVHARIIGTLW